MEIKVGQYYRYEDGNISKLYNINQLPAINYNMGKWPVIKVADMIQDLIQVGDLIEILHTGNDTYYKLEVLRIDNEILVTSHLTIAFKQASLFYYDNDLNEIPMIRAIFTPNKSKTVYTLQYSEEEL